MKLETTIKPRRHHTDRVNTDVRVTYGRNVYVFAFDPDIGSLVCDVDSEEDVAAMLKTGNFQPASEADYDAATALVGGPVDDDGPDDEGPDDDDVPPLPPQEANTPPAAAPMKPNPVGGRKRNG